MRLDLELGEVLVEHALERVVLALDGTHGLVERFGDLRRLGIITDALPARLLRHPEDVGLIVGIAVFNNVLGLILADEILAFRVARPAIEIGLPELEAVGDVLEKDQPQHGVLVGGGIQVDAQVVGRFPEQLSDVIPGHRLPLLIPCQLNPDGGPILPCSPASNSVTRPVMRFTAPLGYFCFRHPGAGFSSLRLVPIVRRFKLHLRPTCDARHIPAPAGPHGPLRSPSGPTSTPGLISL